MKKSKGYRTKVKKVVEIQRIAIFMGSAIQRVEMVFQLFVNNFLVSHVEPPRFCLSDHFQVITGGRFGTSYEV